MGLTSRSEVPRWMQAIVTGPLVGSEAIDALRTLAFDRAAEFAAQSYERAKEPPPALQLSTITGTSSSKPLRSAI